MYSSVNPSDLKGMIGRINIIDIRDSYLYNLSNIPTSRNVPINYLLMDPGRYMNKDKTYYIYCQSGYKSASACNKLSGMGYKVVNVLGGYNSYNSF